MKKFTVMTAEGAQEYFLELFGHQCLDRLRGYVEAELGRPVYRWEFKLRKSTLYPTDIFVTHVDSNFWGVIEN